MIAASARGSGTSAPDSSNLKRGCCTSFRAAALAAAFARERRRRADLAEEVGFLAVAAAFLVAVGRFAVVGAAEEISGTPSASTAAMRQIDRRFLNSCARITGNPFGDRLLRLVSAL